MIRLEDLALFVRAAAISSFSEVAREVDLLPGQVSAAIKRLERELDVRLFARSTRSVRLTAEGERYLPFAQEALASLDEGHERLRGEQAQLRGVLKIAAPSDLGRNILLPWFTAFRRQHPNLTLRLLVSDRVTDVFRDPVDVAIRYGELDDASYVTLPLAPANRRFLVASPGYLARCGTPTALENLAQHDCLPYLLGGRVYDKWAFQENGRRRVVTVRGPLQADDAEISRRLAVDGEGIAYKSWLDVAEDVRARRLVVLLRQFEGQTAPLHLVCPHRKQFSPAVQQLYRLLRQRCDALVAAMPDTASMASTTPAA